MRKLILLAICLFWAGFASAACSNTSFGNGWTCIQQKSGTFTSGSSGTTATVTLGATTGAGHQIIVRAFICADVSCAADTTSITLTPSDGASDTFIAGTNSPFLTAIGGGAANTGKLAMWAITSVGATTTFTVTCSTTCWYLTVGASEWTGGATSTPWDTGVGAVNGAASGATTASVSGGTSANATDLVTGYIALGVGNAVTPGTGFTEIGEDITGDEWEAKSVTTTGAQSCTWTWTGATNWNGICLALKASTGVASSHSGAWAIVVN